MTTASRVSTRVLRVAVYVTAFGAAGLAAPRPGQAQTPAPAPAVSCESLAKLTLPHTTVTLATLVPAGGFTPPGGDAPPSRGPDFTRLPAFCRIAATLAPTRDSAIGVEVWLPASGWNGRFQAVGNAGWTGSINYAALARALARGYATASTDTGHKGDRADFGVGHPEKLVDFAHRAVHLMAGHAKAVIGSYYGAPPRYSYWNGCSSGGRQGLKAAQRFPGDFDGIIAGAPANNWIRQKAAVVEVSKIVHREPDAYIPVAKYALIHRAVLEACDGLDGVEDGVLEDPRACTFDPAALLCTGEDAATCLTAKQVESARAIYAPIRNPRTAEVIFPGLPRGTELSWDVQAGPTPRTVAYDLFAYFVYENPKWDFRTLDLDRDVALAEKMDAEGPQMAAVDPNLKPFLDRGGKLLMYHGWADPNIVATNSIDYYEGVVRTLGDEVRLRDSFRLFMVPGMGHCGGGDGPNTFDMLSALEQWVEQGKPPDRIVASRVADGKVVRTRPLCPYPQVAVHSGTGSTDDAASFACTAPRRQP